MPSPSRCCHHNTTQARAFESVNKDFFDVTPYANSEFRVQIFTPSYIDPSTTTRPTLYYAPANIEYGSVFNIASVNLPGNGANAAVVLLDPGTNTHSLSMGRRAQPLAFAVRGKVKNAKGMLSIQVEAPATAAVAPPGFYLLYLVSGDGSGSYSEGVWVQLRPSGFSTPPLTIPKDAKLLKAASSNFEPTAVTASANKGQTAGSNQYSGRTVANTAAFDLASRVPAAMGSGSAGAYIRIAANSSQVGRLTAGGCLRP